MSELGGTSVAEHRLVAVLRPFVGQTILAAARTFFQFGIIGGLAITTGARTLRLANVGDACEVYPSLPADFRPTVRVAR